MYPRSSKEQSGFLACSGNLNRFLKSSTGFVTFLGSLPVKNAFDPKMLSTQSDLIAPTGFRRNDRIDRPVELIVNSFRVLYPTAVKISNVCYEVMGVNSSRRKLTFWSADQFARSTDVVQCHQLGNCAKQHLKINCARGDTSPAMKSRSCYSPREAVTEESFDILLCRCACSDGC